MKQSMSWKEETEWSQVRHLPEYRWSNYRHLAKAMAQSFNEGKSKIATYYNGVALHITLTWSATELIEGMISAAIDAARNSDGSMRIEARGGESIAEYSKRLAKATAYWKLVDGTFAGIVTPVFGATTVSAKEIERTLQAEFDRQQAVYRESSDWKRNAANHKAHARSLSERAKALEQNLATLDMTDNEAILDWICAYQSTTDYGDVEKDSKSVIAFFNSHGYVYWKWAILNAVKGAIINLVEGDSEKPVDDADALAHSIIKPALDGIKRFWIIPFDVHSSVWRRKSLYGNRVKALKATVASGD